MRALKVLVVVMGVMILVGFAALIVVIAGRLTDSRLVAPASEPAAAAAIELPAGARVGSMSVAADRLAVELVLPDGNRRIVVIDLATGRQLRAIPLHTAP